MRFWSAVTLTMARQALWVYLNQEGRQEEGVVIRVTQSPRESRLTTVTSMTITVCGKQYACLLKKSIRTEYTS